MKHMLIGAALVLASPVWAAAQNDGAVIEGSPRNVATRGSVVLTPGPQFDAGGMHRFLFGDNWRDLWTSPIQVPVLDLSRFAGGIVPFKAGGNQSRTLHFNGADGRRYVFRSVAKEIERILGDDLEGTWAGGMAQDQTSANQPSASTIADVLQGAAGVLHPWPQLVVMPDDPALGEYREIYANMLGHIEIKPDDVEDGVTPYAGASKIQGTDKLLENLDQTLEYRFDSRAWLKARLMDALMGDFDRGADQWDWARYDEDGVKTYRPIARDRDWAFMKADGNLIAVARNFYPKLGVYDGSHDPLRSITFMTREFDRSHLAPLPWSEWEEVIAELQASLTDAVVDRAMVNQPEEFGGLSATELAAAFKSRRDGLRQVARELYGMVNREADVFAADERELAEIERRADGSLHVRLTRFKKDGELATDEGPAFDRAFLPDETDEVRVYMLEGNDSIIVRGAGRGDITLRIIGGGGDDTLVDSATVRGGTGTQFYDSGESRIVANEDTNVHTDVFVTGQPATLNEPDPDDEIPPAPSVLEERRGRFQDQWNAPGADFYQRRLQNRNQRYWGTSNSKSPVIDLRDGAGLILGGSVSRTAYGFRAAPYASRIEGSLMYGIEANRFAATFGGDWHPANSRIGLRLDALASGFEAQRFYGLGNDTELMDAADALLMRNELLVQPAVQWFAGDHTNFTAGPVARFVDPRVPDDSPALLLDMPGSDDRYGAVGGRVALQHERMTAPGRGYRAALEASTFKGVQGGDGSFSSAGGEVAAYLPLFWPTLALRAGGEQVWGDFPLHEAALLGGRNSLRGYRWNRFTGDAAAFGNAELRIPVTRAELLVRGDLGLILFADAGRVWLDGESEGGWHTSQGVGISFASLSRAVSVLYAQGEEGRIYINLGLPF